MRQLIILFLVLSSFSHAAENRPYKMGFSTWLYAPTGEAIINTAKFLKEEGDMYTIKFDEFIPWRSLIDNQPLPAEFQKKIGDNVIHRLPDHKLQLCLTAVKDSFDGLLNDVDGSLPQETYSSPVIEEAYIKYCEKMIEIFRPDYVLTGMKSNELYTSTTPMPGKPMKSFLKPSSLNLNPAIGIFFLVNP